MQQSRLIAFLRLLHRKSDSNHRLTAPELAELMDKGGIPVERRSIYRFIEAIREGGIEVEKTGSGYYIKGGLLGPEEARLLLIAARSCPLVEPQADQALESRLLGLLSDYQSADLRAYPGLGVCKRAGCCRYAVAAAAFQAIKNKRQLSVEQAKWELDKRNRPMRTYIRLIVDPFGVIAHEGAFELICKIEGEDAPSAIKLADVRDARVEATLRREWSGFNADDYARKRALMQHGPTENIVLYCKQDVIGDIAERFGVNVRLVKHGDGRLRVALSATADAQFVSWVLRHGDSVEVAAPPELRSRLKEILNNAAGRYSS